MSIHNNDNCEIGMNLEKRKLGEILRAENNQVHETMNYDCAIHDKKHCQHSSILYVPRTSLLCKIATLY